MYSTNLLVHNLCLCQRKEFYGLPYIIFSQILLQLAKILSEKLERDPIEEAESIKKAELADKKNRGHEVDLEELRNEEKVLLEEINAKRAAKLQELNKLKKHTEILKMLSSEKLEDRRFADNDFFFYLFIFIFYGFSVFPKSKFSLKSIL